MKTTFKLMALAGGMLLAVLLTTKPTHAVKDVNKVDVVKKLKSNVHAVDSGGCSGTGACGITAHGTFLFGQWVEG